MRPTSALGVLSGFVLVVTGGVFASAAPALAAPPACSARPGAPDVGDIDGDGLPDPVVTSSYGGHPYVEVYNTKAGTQAVDLENSLGMDGITRLVIANVTGDGCADAVGSYSDEEQDKVGSFIIPGSDRGLVVSTAILFNSPGGDVAVVKSPRIIAVNNYDSVALFPLAADGTPGTPVIRGNIPTGSEAEGSIESMVADGNKLVIGTPSAKVGKRRAAGVVRVWTFTGKGLAYNSLTLTQNSRGFATAVESRDFFGSALAIRGNYVAIGVPHETLGKKKETGLVHVVKLSSGVKPAVSKVYNLNQNSPGIPGRNETRDRWGYSVGLAVGVGCTRLSLVAGAPFETVGNRAQSGAITLAGIGKACGDSWSPGKRPLGTVRAKLLGTEVATLTNPAAGADTVLLRASGAGLSQVFSVKRTGPRRWAAKELPAPAGTASQRGVAHLGLPHHG